MTRAREDALLEVRLRDALAVANEKERVIVDLKSALDDRLELIRRLDAELRCLRCGTAAETLPIDPAQNTLTSNREVGERGGAPDADEKEQVIRQLKTELDARLELINRLDSDLHRAHGELRAKEDARTELEQIAQQRARIIHQLEDALKEKLNTVSHLNAQLEAKCKEADEIKFVARVSLGVIVGVQLSPG